MSQTNNPEVDGARQCLSWVMYIASGMTDSQRMQCQREAAHDGPHSSGHTWEVGLESGAAAWTPGANKPGHGEAVRCAAHYRPSGSWRGTDGNDWQHAAEAAERMGA